MGWPTAIFWAVMVIAGLLVPLVLARSERRGLPQPAIAPVLVLSGGFALRFVLVAGHHGLLLESFDSTRTMEFIPTTLGPHPRGDNSVDRELFVRHVLTIGHAGRPRSGT